MKTIENLIFLADFIKQQSLAGNLSKEVVIEVEKLWNKYKQSNVNTDCSIISADFGMLGSLIIRTVDKLRDDETKLNYKSGDYDFISIVSNSTRRILWTDYSSIEPYNRNSGLYCDGASFDFLGEPINYPTYREFDAVSQYESNISFGVWGFSYNDFYGSVTFGICIKNEQVDEFIKLLRDIIGK